MHAQQARVLKEQTRFSVGSYYGQMRANFWRASTWTQELAKHDVLVMPPQILLNILESGFIQARP